MIEGGLLLLAFGVLCLLALPLILAGALLLVLVKVVVTLALLPLRLLAWGTAGLFNGFFVLFKLVGIFFLGAILIVLGLAVLAVPALSFAPFLLVGGVLWIAWRLAHPAKAPART